MPTDTVAAMAAPPAIRESLPFTLLGSPCSVRVQVRFSLLGSAFGVHRSRFGGVRFGVRAFTRRPAPHRAANRTSKRTSNVNANREARTEKCERRPAGQEYYSWPAVTKRGSMSTG